MYLVTFSTVRRPSMTPSCTTPRSRSSSTRSAASLATSAALSTEIPTSAPCKAEASLMPSPRKPTTRPARFSASRMRSFCCGVTRQNRLTDLTAFARSASSLRRETSWPVSTPWIGIPISVQTWRVMRSLSPLRIFTSTPPLPARAPRRRHRVSADRQREQSPRRSACPRRSGRSHRLPPRATRCRARDSPLRPTTRSD